MIKTIHLTNFQAHRDSFLELHPGVNVITGQSDNGKSSIVRALLWLFFNKSFSLDEIKTRGAAPKDWTGVTITTPVGTSISRMRNRDVNKYVLKSPSHPDGVDLKAVGTNVPDEVREIFPVSDVNAQSQLDSPYLLSASPGEVARTFNSLAGLQDIDISLSSVKSRISKSRSSISSITDQMQRVDADLGKYKDLDRIETLISTMDSLTQDIDGFSASITSLCSDQHNLETYSSQIASYHEAVEDKKDLDRLQQDQERLVDVAQKMEKLSEMLKSWCDSDNKATQVPFLTTFKETCADLQSTQDDIRWLVGCQKELASCQDLVDLGADAEKDKKDLFEITNLISVVQKTSATISVVGKANTEIEALDQKVAKSKQNEETLRSELSSLLTELGVCPVCGSTIS